MKYVIALIVISGWIIFDALIFRQNVRMEREEERKVVVIKGMRMPKNCRECHIRYEDQFGTNWCAIEQDNMSATCIDHNLKFDDRPPWCPLAEFKEVGHELVERW